MVILIVDSRTNRYISYIVAGIDRQLYPTKNMIHCIEEFCHKKQRYFYILEMRIMNVIFIKIKEKSNCYDNLLYFSRVYQEYLRPQLLVETKLLATTTELFACTTELFACTTELFACTRELFACTRKLFACTTELFATTTELLV